MSETAPVAISQTANVAVSDRPSDKAADGRKLPVRKRSSREKWAKRKKEALRHLWWPARPGPDWAESRERYDIGTRVRPTGGADTDAQAGMPAGLFERSTGLGDAWEAADVWLEPHGGADELRAGVARRRGAAVPRPVCGAPHLHPRDGGPGRRAARKASPTSERPLAVRARAMAEAPRAARPMPGGGRPPEGSIGGRAGWRTPTSRR